MQLSYSDVPVSFLRVDERQFRMSPQRGTQWRTTWGKLASAMATPRVSSRKDAFGGYAMGTYDRAIRRRANLVTTQVLTFDFDHCGVTELATRGWLLMPSIAHETWSSTDVHKRCRLLMLADRLMTPDEYDAVHASWRSDMLASGVVPDEGAKDASRLSFVPCRPGPSFYDYSSNAFCKSEAYGPSVTVDARVARSVLPNAPTRSLASYPIRHADSYVLAALRSAAECVGAAAEGDRHITLLRQAFGLARLVRDGRLTEYDLHDALMPAWIAVSGERRRIEGEEAIAYAVRTRKKGP